MTQALDLVQMASLIFMERYHKMRLSVFICANDRIYLVIVQRLWTLRNSVDIARIIENNKMEVQKVKETQAELKTNGEDKDKKPFTYQE